jgi:predicted RNA-binding protein YlqC (UPF0109 family)
MGRVHREQEEVSGDYEAGDINTIAGSDPEDDADELDDDDEIDYEDGDINSRGGQASEVDDDDNDDDDDADSDDDANRDDTSVPVAVLIYLARSLADEPDAVVVETEHRRGSIVLRVHVAPEDMGRVIGRRGRTAQAIRTLVGAAGAREGTQVNVDIVDD